MYKKEQKKKNTHTQQSSSAYLFHQCCNIIMQKNIYLFNVTLAEFYRHDYIRKFFGVINNKYDA